MNETANAHVYGYAVIGYTQEIVNSFKINQKKFIFNLTLFRLWGKSWVKILIKIGSYILLKTKTLLASQWSTV